EAGVERRHRLWLERKNGSAAVARLDGELVVDEVEIDLKRPRAMRNGGRGEPSGGHVQRDAPRVIHPGTLAEPNLADDLGPQVQRRIRLAPRLEREVRPRVRNSGEGHGDLLEMLRCAQHDTYLIGVN